MAEQVERTRWDVLHKYMHSAAQTDADLSDANKSSILRALGHSILICGVAAYYRVSSVDEVKHILVLVPVHAIWTTHLHDRSTVLGLIDTLPDVVHPADVKSAVQSGSCQPGNEGIQLLLLVGLSCKAPII